MPTSGSRRPSPSASAEPRLRIVDDRGLIDRRYRSTHADYKSLVGEIQRIDHTAVRPGNVVVVVLDRKSRCSSLKCFIDRLKVFGNGAGSADPGDGILYMTEREIEASTEVAQTLLGHSRGHQGAAVATSRMAGELGHVPVEHSVFATT
jgi:hypothetical protein